MSALETYIKLENMHREIFNQTLLDYPKTMNERDELIETVECELSPENLTCDGEANPQNVREKFNFLKSVETELYSINLQY